MPTHRRLPCSVSLGRKATFAVSAAMLDLLALSPEQAARLDLRDVARLIHEEGART
ncbi:hypothetical protein [Streptomyces sp. TP-A0874]|uniref:hypothetical protein n=1 Tax=Streptomyces sp. TP-A0874 TaxID=549819 RepID=UPI00147D868C|nr:hypothetical protein [Streptomyces sp. TP-A0874]